MLRNYIKISFRNLWNNGLYSIINIAGLALGMSCVLLVSLFVKDEFSYDKFHRKAPQLYRLITTVSNKDGSRHTVGTSGQVQGPSFKAAIPEIIDYVRLMAVGFHVVGEQKTLRLQGVYADDSFFDMFTFPLVHGNLKGAFNNSNGIILTETSALKFFNKTDVVGQVLKVEDGSYSGAFRVIAVAKDVPANSSIQFEIVVPFKYLEKSFTDINWLDQYLSTFVLLHPRADPKQVEAKFSAIFQAKAKEQVFETQKSVGYTPYREYGLQPLTDIHLNRTGLQNENPGSNASGIDAGSITYSYILMGIVGFIFLMACINFINLSIANSLKRAKEIGIRKIIGSNRTQIICQFLFEAGILSLCAFALAAVAAKELLPVFNSFLGKQLQPGKLFDTKLLGVWIGLLAISTLLAGLYPAFILSRFNPIEVLYNKLKLTGRHWFGKVLVIFQFSVAVCLVMATIVYYTQMDFISKKDLGYDPKGIVRVFIPHSDPKSIVERLKQEFSENPAIREVATGTDNSIAVLGGFPTKINGKEVSYVNSGIDEAFLPMLNIPIKEGRNFSRESGADKKHSAIVNEAFVKAAGLANPIGRQFINTWGAGEVRTIVGVVKNYHYSSLKDKIYPQVMLMTDDLPFFWLRIHAGKRAEALALLEKVFRRYAPGHPFEFNFLEDDIDALYHDDKRWQHIINYSAVLSILICSIGLFGLAHLAAAQRTKEIGVRKVLGASVYSIVSLLSRDIIKLVVIAETIAFPVAWLAMNRWLEDFAYRVPIDWQIFVITGSISILIAMITVSSQAFKLAVANPVKSLRTE